MSEIVHIISVMMLQSTNRTDHFNSTLRITFETEISVKITKIRKCLIRLLLVMNVLALVMLVVVMIMIVLKVLSDDRLLVVARVSVLVMMLPMV